MFLRPHRIPASVSSTIRVNNSILHQLLGIGTGFGRELREQRFLFGREMYFHVLQARETRHRGNTGNESAGNPGRRIIRNVEAGKAVFQATSDSRTTGAPAATRPPRITRA